MNKADVTQVGRSFVPEQEELSPPRGAHGTTGNGCQDWPHSVSGVTVMGTASSPTGELFIYLILLLVPLSFPHTNKWGSLSLLCKGKDLENYSAARPLNYLISSEKSARCLLWTETPQALPGALVSPFTGIFCIRLLFAITAPSEGRRSTLRLIKLAQLPSVLLLLCDYSC